MGIGERIKTERLRLGHSQPAFAALGHASKNSQIAWEKGDAHPNAAVMAAWAAAGADVLYILTGERSRAVAEVELLPADEQALVLAYRSCGMEARRNLIATAALLSAGHEAGAAPAPKRSPRPRGGARTTVTTVTARGGHAAGRDLQINNTKPEGVHARKAKRRKPAG